MAEDDHSGGKIEEGLITPLLPLMKNPRDPIKTRKPPLVSCTLNQLRREHREGDTLPLLDGRSLETAAGIGSRYRTGSMPPHIVINPGRASRSRSRRPLRARSTLGSARPRKMLKKRLKMRCVNVSELFRVCVVLIDGIPGFVDGLDWG